MAAQQTGPSKKPGEYPDYIYDTELFLTQILEQQPEYIPTLHCLATIAELKDNPKTAIRHYRSILTHDPTDETAKTNLEYLQAFEETDGTFGRQL